MAAALEEDRAGLQHVCLQHRIPSGADHDCDVRVVLREQPNDRGLIHCYPGGNTLEDLT